MVRVMKKLKRLHPILKAWNRDTFGNYNVALAELQQDLNSLQEGIDEQGYTDDLFDQEVNLQARIGTVLLCKSEHLRQQSRVSWLSDGDMNTRFFHSMVLDFWLHSFLCHLASQADLLTALPSADDIRSVVFSMDRNSAPGSDGFNGAFFQHSWEVVGDDMVAAVRRFFSHGYLPHGLNSNLLYLHLKKADAILVSDYRPIVLGNFFIKVITKILTSRLNAVAAEIVTANQFGFNCMERSIQERNIALKVDIRKAFDTLSWEFVDVVLDSFGFPPLFGSGSSCSRGVKQGDPLSPILFGLANEVLSRLLLDVGDGGLIACMRMSRSLLFPSHLLYANDVLLFCKAERRSCRMIESILLIYASVSGQFCNKAKSTIYFGKGVVPPLLGLLAFGSIIAHFPRWQGMQLSMASRICLVTSVIQSAAIYIMLIYKWPAKLLHDLDRACRSFIWTGSTTSKPKSSVAWNCVCAPKAQGGLNVNWLGYKLVDRIGIPVAVHHSLMQPISDYYFDDTWHFTLDFLQAFPDIAFDIVSVPISGGQDCRAWTHSHFGEVSSSLAMDHIRHSFPSVVGANGFGHRLFWCAGLLLLGVLFWAVSLRPVLCVVLVTLVRAGVHFAGMRERISIIFFGSVLLLDMFGASFSLGSGAVFDVAPVSAVALTIHVKAFISKASRFSLGEMANSVEELLILHGLGVPGRPRRPIFYIYVFWLPPPHPWRKINIDGSVHGSPPLIHAGGVIWDSSSVLGCCHFSAGRG
ncbi:uncharacterized protein LOC131022920 [Salvia miltiorrhiza]|uniref:uncharacterized protein LOC131022920 n=1 Tax=Salvia miltiorrhiza TaxID=226208 RepID=UPI0025AC21C2|nr:uncharacterized protein LOC131022920 [Salvia miltiorrhiza]